MRSPIKWTKEAEEYVLSHYEGVGPTEMAERVQKLFGLPTNRNNLKSFYSKHHLNSGLTGRFEVGQIAPNKGKKVSPEHYAKSQPTMFKKGSVPANKTPIGTIRQRAGSGGYFFRKVGPGCHDWKLHHRLVWEEHNGPIPDGYKLTFLDGDKTNCSIENLALISTSASVRRAQLHMMYKDPDLNRAAITYSELKSQIYKKQRRE